MKLYEIANNISQVLEMSENGVDGLEDTLEALDGSFDEKVEKCVMAWRDLIADRDKCKQEAYRLTERANSFDKKADALKNYIENMMIRTGKTKIKTPLFSAWIQNNTPSVDVIDETMIPPLYFTPQKPLLDKAAIKNDLQANIPISGVQLKQSQSIRIR